MEVESRAHRSRRVESPRVMSVRIRAMRALGQEHLRHARLSRPARASDARRERNWNLAAHHVPAALQLEHEVVPVRAELDLEVPIVGPGDEELDDLVLPELPECAHRRRGPWIALERGVDPDHELTTFDARVDVGDLGRVDRLTVPGARDGETHGRAITALVIVVQKYGGSSLKDVE